MMAHNTTVQLGGNAFLMCKVAGIDRVGVNWVCLLVLIFHFFILLECLSCRHCLLHCKFIIFCYQVVNLVFLMVLFAVRVVVLVVLVLEFCSLPLCPIFTICSKRMPYILPFCHSLAIFFG